MINSMNGQDKAVVGCMRLPDVRHRKNVSELCTVPAIIIDALTNTLACNNSI